MIYNWFRPGNKLKTTRAHLKVIRTSRNSKWGPYLFLRWLRYQNNLRPESVDKTREEHANNEIRQLQKHTMHFVIDKGALPNSVYDKNKNALEDYSLQCTLGSSSSTRELTVKACNPRMILRILNVLIGIHSWAKFGKTRKKFWVKRNKFNSAIQTTVDSQLLSSNKSCENIQKSDEKESISGSR